MSREILNHLGNEVDLPEGRPFGAILGLAPSKGARSPVLWRAAFAALGLEADFHPFDVTPEALPGLVEALRDDPRFLGGAVAVPHKELLPPLLDHVDPAAADIGAVNALRRLPDGGIAGANTDGLAAVESLESVLGSVQGRPVTLLGLGGAGKAVAACLNAAGAELTLWNRDTAKATAYASHLSRPGRRVRAVAELAPALRGAAALVNCTSVGFMADGSENPHSPVEPALLDTLAFDAVVFDIIYQPLRTALLKAAEATGRRTLNGKAMNLGQAVIAFCLANPRADAAMVRQAMGRV